MQIRCHHTVISLLIESQRPSSSQPENRLLKITDQKMYCLIHELIDLICHDELFRQVMPTQSSTLLNL